MKNLIKKTLLSTACTFAFAAHATSDNVRLVVSQPTSSTFAVSSQSANSGCVATEDGVTFCLPIKQVPVGVAAAKSESAAPAYSVYTIDSQGVDAHVIARLFNESGRFGLVEVDAEVTAKPVSETDFATAVSVSNAASLVNDTHFAANQENNYFANLSKSPAGSDIAGLWTAVGLPSVLERKDPIDLLILDSEFEVSKETPYDDGRNFSTTAEVNGGPFQLPGNDFRESPSLDNVCETHGMAVTSMAAGKANNAFGSAGVNNNVKIHALRTMTCGVGFLSDSSNALLWLAGKPFKNAELVKPYLGKPGIVNMSLGSKTTSCPTYMQTAIDAVREKGFTVVVSAGNEGKDAETHLKTPANCDGVIVVGSLDRQGKVASFSNTGDEVHVMTQGEWIPHPCEDNDDSDSPRWCFGQGTSYSTPIVSGVLSVLKQQLGSSDAVLKASIGLTSSPVNDARCNNGQCGAGLLNAKAAYDFAKSEKEGTLNFMTHALADKSACDQKWLLDNFGNAAPMCRMYKVTLFNNYTKPGDTFKLYSVADGESFTTAELKPEGEFTQNKLMLSDITVKGRQYGVQLCRDGGCTEDVYPLNMTAAKAPASCL